MMNITDVKDPKFNKELVDEIQKHQSDAVRHLVEQAKERHELRFKTRQLCMEHLKELRKMRWFMHNNFELCL
uniref:Uncharacterized protein n=1 Tax=Ditylenchus dipsaci TaxID=166011 RepID=A0A915CVM9_9BILA